MSRRLNRTARPASPRRTRLIRSTARAAAPIADPAPPAKSSKRIVDAAQSRAVRTRRGRGRFPIRLPVLLRGSDAPARRATGSPAARAPDLALATRARRTAHRPAKTVRPPQPKAPANRQYSQRWFPQPQRHGQPHTPGDSAPIVRHQRCVADQMDRHRWCATPQPAATARRDHPASKDELQKRRSALSFTVQACFPHRAETFPPPSYHGGMLTRATWRIIEPHAHRVRGRPRPHGRTDSSSQIC